MSARTPALDWEWFLYDLDPTTTPPPVTVRARLHAIASAGRALRILHNRGWAAAYPYLQQLRPNRATARYAGLPAETAIRLARREIFTCQLVTRALEPSGQCLHRSLALATYLRVLGLPAQVTLARSLGVASTRDAFHSWTELHGCVLNEKQDIGLCYSVLQRVPAE